MRGFECFLVNIRALYPNPVKIKLLKINYLNLFWLDNRFEKRACAFLRMVYLMES